MKLPGINTDKSEEEVAVMKQSPRMMILTAGYGDGHLQASRALKQSFIDQGVKEVTIIDLMKEAHPLLNTITTKLYVTSTTTSKYGLDYYGWSYYITRDTKHDSSWNKYMNFLGKKKLKEIIRQVRPDAVINAFPFGAAQEIGREMGIPTFTVVTDYALHSRWLHKDTDKYYVATAELEKEILSKGITPEQIEVSGIPIRSAFYNINSHAASSLHKELNPGKKIVLISAGSYGVLSKIDEMAESLLAQCDCQLAIVCGRNRKLQDKLNTVFARNTKVHIFGFVEHIHELMAISSCIVTKAGGLTLSEALTLQLPVFIFKPFAGQEKENALYFENKGIAQISHSTKELEEQIVRFLSDGSAALAMKRRMTALRRWEASDYIVRNILQTVEQKQLLPI